MIKKAFNDFFDRIQVTGNMKSIVSALSKDIGERNIAKYESLEMARKYIEICFREFGVRTTMEKYQVGDEEANNIIAEFCGKEKPSEILLIGAHYDTIEGSSGANDNATGIAALIEIGKVLTTLETKRTIRLVAFSTEEPPFFLTDLMGSMVHARGCSERNENIRLMVSLDMLGFSSYFVKQKFPLERMSENCPAIGNFLTVVSLPSNSNSAFLWKKHYNSGTDKKIHDFIAPASVNGINLSDHSSFHKYGFPSILITDTGFYRNSNYHTENDLYDTINFNFLYKNIKNICRTVILLANTEEII